MKLSILIPTHKRPQLFKRCLQSDLDQITDDIEVIINNDSNDIEELMHPQVRDYYFKFDTLSEVYQHLLNHARGEYVYFLEDDDYLSDDFISKLTLDADIIAGNYAPMYNPKYLLECMLLYKNQKLTPREFAKSLNYEHLQLSQYVFRKEVIAEFIFPLDNNVHNDINLVLFAASKSKTVKTVNKIFYHQTTDAGDNISFKDTTPSIEVTQSMNFLDQYKDLLNE